MRLRFRRSFFVKILQKQNVSIGEPHINNPACGRKTMLILQGGSQAACAELMQLAIKITNPAEPESGQDERRIRAAACAFLPEHTAQKRIFTHLPKRTKNICAATCRADIVKRGGMVKKAPKAATLNYFVNGTTSFTASAVVMSASPLSISMRS